MTYEFTQQWFEAGEQTWPTIFAQMPVRKRFLEVGSFEGRSSVWLFENALEDGGELVCIDTWGGGEEHGGLDMGAAQKRFIANIELAKEKHPNRSIAAYKGTSTQYLAQLLANYRDPFDFIYIDGSHIARDVLTDACMAWPLLKKDGVMIFDDYLWGDTRDILHRPKLAIEAFVNLFAEQLQVTHVGYQLVLQKRV
jgi:predicted O-methyltransferase YrrM